MIDSELAAFAADGRALIVGAVATDGEPHATRGWGLVVDDDGTPAILLDGDDRRVQECLAPGRPLAVTAADVRTLESVQFKGTALGVEPPLPSDTEVVDHFIERFFGDIVATDGTDPDVLHRVVPSRFVRCRFECDAVYDQTPGPGAGAPVTSS